MKKPLTPGSLLAIAGALLPVIWLAAPGSLWFIFTSIVWFIANLRFHKIGSAAANRKSNLL
jgi:hypothetical protein